jgi:hypothetical protein
MKSIKPRAIANRMVDTITTFVDAVTSSLLGQTTFLSSAKLSWKYLKIFFMLNGSLKFF